MIDVADLATVHSLLLSPPNRVVHQIEIRAVRWSLQCTDEVRSLCTDSSRSYKSLAGTVGWSTVLLEGEVARDRTI